MNLLKPSLDFFAKIEERNPAFNWSAVIATKEPSNYVIQLAKILKMQQQGDNYYTHGNGLPFLKESIENYFQRSGVATNEKNIVISGSLFNIIEDILNCEKKHKMS